MYALDNRGLIAIIDKDSCKLKVFDIDTMSFVDWLAIDLPTKECIFGDERSDKLKIEAVFQ